MVGWKALLEGLPSTEWMQYMSTHYSTHHIRCSPHCWLSTFLHSLHTLAWQQWSHRNQILHQINKPCQKQANHLLISLIIQELTTGPLNLPTSNHHYFQQPLGQLLFQSIPFRQAWYSKRHICPLTSSTLTAHS